LGGSICKKVNELINTFDQKIEIFNQDEANTVEAGEGALSYTGVD